MTLAELLAAPAVKFAADYGPEHSPDVFVVRPGQPPLRPTRVYLDQDDFLIIEAV